MPTLAGVFRLVHIRSPLYCQCVSFIKPTLESVKGFFIGDHFPAVKNEIGLAEYFPVPIPGDKKSLTTAPQTVYQAHIDLPCSWLAVEFRDGAACSDRTLLQKIPSVAITLPVP